LFHLVMMLNQLSRFGRGRRRSLSTFGCAQWSPELNVCKESNNSKEIPASYITPDIYHWVCLPAVFVGRMTIVFGFSTFA
jgi:hypothetical protein